MNIKQLSLAAGPLGYLACQLLDIPFEQRVVLGTAFWMLLWWFTEVLPLGITALLPLVLFGGTGILSNSELANAYANAYSYSYAHAYTTASASASTASTASATASAYPDTDADASRENPSVNHAYWYTD